MKTRTKMLMTGLLGLALCVTAGGAAQADPMPVNRGAAAHYTRGNDGIHKRYGARYYAARPYYRPYYRPYVYNRPYYPQRLYRPNYYYNSGPGYYFGTGAYRYYPQPYYGFYY